METVQVAVHGEGGGSSAPVAGTPPRRRGWRRWVVWGAALLVVILGIGGTTGFLVYGATYQPLQPGEVTGPTTGPLRAITDGLTDTNLLLIGKEGTRATFMLSMANDGSHPVRVLSSPQQPPGPSGLPRFFVKWAKSPYDTNIYRGAPKNFPTTLSPGHELLLIVTVIQPRCYDNGGYYTSNQLRIRWSALGWHHVYDYPLGDVNPDGALPIVSCPPHKALSHIDKSF